ncbi:glycoside hydrolase domain-containing protein [Brevibacillus centrosporus]|uniref:glycoside hydrolase domain-containing protein n=1 Tax=Brevibacillus centrosporus TaxID=54910 RepID=UPI003B023350
MATKGIDCAVPLTAEKAKAMAAAGYKFAARYMVPERLAWKRLTKAEAELITAAGMKVVSVFETTANRPAGGAAAGLEDGTEAYKEAQLIGQPIGSAIYFAVDFDTKATDYVAIEAYLRAAATKIPGYEVGVYAEYDVIEEMAKRGAVKHFWQTYAWSGGKKSPRANIYQHKNGQTLAGHTVDFNESYGGEGWWDTRPQAVEKPGDKPAEIPGWKRQDHDELRAAGILTTDHSATLDDAVPQWMLFALLNRLRKGETAPQEPQPKPDPKPAPTPNPKPEPEPQPAPEPPAILDWAEVERRTSLASVQITFGTAGRGSGTLLHGGYVLTAKHVGNGLNTITVRTRGNGLLTADLVAVHPGYKGAEGKIVNVDVALYRVTDAKLLNVLPSLPLSTQGVTAGQDLLAVVHGDAFGKVKRGAVDRVSISTSSPPTPWEFDCSIDGNPGDSGGAAVNQFGELSGVIIQETMVNAKIGSAWQRVPGCEAVKVAHPVVTDWLKQYL